MSRNVQSLERGLVVLEALVRNGPSGVTEIANALDLDKTIVHRLLTTLVSMGYVQQDQNRKYMTGVQLRLMGAKALTGLDLRSLALPYMQDLAGETQGVAHLAKIAESRVIYIQRVQHPSLTITTTDVGGEAPGYCSAAGKVIWAYLPEPQLHYILSNATLRQHTPNTITDPMTIQQHLAQIREQGYAIDNGEHRVGLTGIGAPVYNFAGNVAASICVGTLNSRLQAGEVDTLIDKVKEVASQLSYEMGYSNGRL